MSHCNIAYLYQIIMLLTVCTMKRGIWGLLTGGLKCRLSNLRNGHVACPLLMSCVAFKMLSCRMSNIFSGHVNKPYVACRF